MPKNLILVGMGPGNGESIAKRFGKEGFKIFMIGRNEEKLKKHQEDLEKNKIKAEYKISDAGNEEHLRIAFKEILHHNASPEVLVYNASVLDPRPPSKLVPDHVVKDLKSNVVGAITSVQEVIPGMSKKGKGTILITGGGLALHPHYEYASLGIGKAAIRNFAYSLAQECKDLGIHVGTVTINGMVKKGTKFDPDKIAEEFWKLHNQKKKDWQTEVIYE